MADSSMHLTDTSCEITGDQNQLKSSDYDKSNETTLEVLKTRLLDRVAKSDGFFKSQQRGDPDLTYDEKLTIATEMLKDRPGTFLNRYGKYFIEEDLQYFQSRRTDYTIDFYIKEIQKRFDSRMNQTKIRNRRLEAMKELEDQGDYFSDREMKSRDPRLYEQMVGKYLTDEEIKQQVGETDGSISSVLFHHIEALHNNELYAKQVEKEMSQMEELDSDDDDQEVESSEEEEELEDEDDAGETIRKRPTISDEERIMLRNEFLAVMQQRFIHGQDQEFDYRKVDDNVEYDPLSIRAQDEEEKYFDEEDSESVCSRDSSSSRSMNTAPQSGSNTPKSMDAGHYSESADTTTDTAIYCETMETNNSCEADTKTTLISKPDPNEGDLCSDMWKSCRTENSLEESVEMTGYESTNKESHSQAQSNAEVPANNADLDIETDCMNVASNDRECDTHNSICDR